MRYSPRPFVRAPSLPRLLTVSRLHIVAIAVMGALTFGFLLTGVLPWRVLPVVALDWFLVNLLNRIVDVKEDRANQIQGADWADRHRTAIAVGGFTALAGSFAVLHLLLPGLTPLRAAFHGLGLAYNWRLVPTPAGRRRIKEMYGLKNVASAIGFLLTVFGYPLATLGLASAPTDISLATVWVTAGWFFRFELSYEVIYDSTDFVREDTVRINDHICITGTIDILCALAAGKGPDRSIFALGYSGWGPGQLEAEMHANSWLTVPADDELIFHTDLSKKWEKSLEKLGIEPAFLSIETGRA